MLRNLFQIPDTFEPEDRRRRQIVSILLVVSVVAGLATLAMTLGFYPEVGSTGSRALIVWAIVCLLVFGLLWVANRSPRIPGWVSGMFLIAMFIFAIVQTDSPAELYNGRSIVSWVIPIMLGSIIFRPGMTFIVASAIAGLMEANPPPDNVGVNYYAMLSLFFIAFICWLAMSITNRAIRDARRQAANLQAIYEYVADGVLVLDLQGNFLSANPALLSMIPNDELREFIARPLEESMPWKHRVYSVHASAVPDVGTVAVIRDETRRHEIERARDALIATASHELRTPLAAIMNYLELLVILVRLDKIETQEFDEHLTRALENSRRLQQLVNNILDQAQIQAGVLVLKEQPFDLRALLEKTRQLLDVLIRQKQLSCDIQVAPAVPARLWGDADRLYQVLVNLIGNAIKFTDRGGIKINVSVPQKESLTIEVADTGAGIPPEQLPDIFEAFRRGSNYAQRERQGAGLGLSIAKEIVIRMGGELLAASEPGIGSTFTVTLPIEVA